MAAVWSASFENEKAHAYLTFGDILKLEKLQEFTAGFGNPYRCEKRYYPNRDVGTAHLLSLLYRREVDKKVKDAENTIVFTAVVNRPEFQDKFFRPLFFLPKDYHLGDPNRPEHRAILNLAIKQDGIDPEFIWNSIYTRKNKALHREYTRWGTEDDMHLENILEGFLENPILAIDRIQQRSGNGVYSAGKPDEYLTKF